MDKSKEITCLLKEKFKIRALLEQITDIRKNPYCIYQRGGDSPTGRYLLFHLWPFALAELINNRLSVDRFLDNPLQTTTNIEARALWEILSTVSGFPEPYLSNSTRSYNRWSISYSRQLIREDIHDLSGVKSVYEIETLYHLLPEKVGNPLSIASLSRDLKVAYNTINNWLQLFERFYLSFTITPWTAKIARAIQKERKVYLWYSPRISNKAFRFENMVGLELYRAVTLWKSILDHIIRHARQSARLSVSILVLMELYFRPFISDCGA